MRIERPNTADGEVVNDSLVRSGRPTCLPLPTVITPTSESLFDSAMTEERLCNAEDIETQRSVGQNIYILAFQLKRYAPALAHALDPENHNDEATREALTYYRQHTAQIEIVRADRALERVVFPVPEVCEHLTRESKDKLLALTTADITGSKVPGFFAQWKPLYEEMRWQLRLKREFTLLQVEKGS